MVTKLKTLLLTVAALLAFMGGTTVIGATTASAADASLATTCSEHTPFFGLVPWYQYMGDELDDGTPLKGESAAEGQKHKCNVKCFNFLASQQPNACNQKRSDVPLVMLAVVDDLLRIAALVAIGYVIVGAFKLMTAQGSADRAKQGQETVINALIGLAIAITAVGFVTFIGNALGGS